MGDRLGSRHDLQTVHLGAERRDSSGRGAAGERADGGNGAGGADAVADLEHAGIARGDGPAALVLALSEQAPDVRLKIERPTLGEISAWEADPRVRGVEFRLPQTGVWMGYETPEAEGDLPRATLSIQRGF